MSCQNTQLREPHPGRCQGRSAGGAHAGGMSGPSPPALQGGLLGGEDHPEQTGLDRMGCLI